MKNAVAGCGDRLVSRVCRWGLALCCWLILGGCPGEVALQPRQEPVTDVLQEQVFHERVNRLNAISLGATLAQVLQACGPPTEQRHEAGRTVYLYRLSHAKAGTPFSGPGRVVYLSWETRITFDQHGRVAAINHQP